jgi:hypothetical protein
VVIADLELDPLEPGGVESKLGGLLKEEDGVPAQLVYPGQQAERASELFTRVVAHERSPLVHR